MRIVLLALAATTLAACAELPSTANVDEVTAETQTAEVPPSANKAEKEEVKTAETAVAPEDETVIFDTGENSQSTEPTVNIASVPPIDDELLTIAGVEASAELFASPQRQRVLMEHLIRETFPDRYRTMLAIANCESTGLIHWLPDGTLRPHATGASSAAGVLQVLRITHGPEMRAKGLDIENPLHYMKWVRFMVDRRPSLSDWAECLPGRLASR